MTAPGPILTLTSDCGTADGFVGAMKGRILSIAPAARLCDISHDIAPQEVLQGAWCLRRAAPRFPDGTVHLAVVDPGVGSSRAGLVVETERFLLVGPDNGLLSLAAREAGLRRIYRIRENPPHWHKSGSFDGLTMFAPVAAHLLLGTEPGACGEPSEEMVELPGPAPLRLGNEIHGAILFFDRFGNAISNITRTDLKNGEPGKIMLSYGVEAVYCSHDAAVADLRGRIGAFWNSDDHLELALFSDSLRDSRRIHAGDGLRVLVKGESAP